MRRCPLAGPAAGPGECQLLGLLPRMAEHGAGIAVVSLAFVSEAIARGELVRLLPDWQAPSQTAR